MIKRFIRDHIKKSKYALIMLATNFIMAKTAMAADYGGIESKSASGFGTKIKELVEQVGMPIGGGILFLSVVIIAIKLVITSTNAKKRAETMEGFLYLGIGGAVLGGALFIAGALLGLGEVLDTN